MNPTVSVLITNYNTWPQTLNCIAQLDRWSASHLAQVLVIDDASEQPNPKHLPPYVHVSRNLRNCGYVASVNIGFRQLEEDIILLLDSDAYITMDLVPAVKKAFSENSALGILGFRLIDRQGRYTGSSELEPDVVGLLIGQKIDKYWGRWIRPLYCRRFTVFSCAMAVRRAVFEQLGGFDEGFDFLDADIDFSMRVTAAGWQVLQDHSLVACHEGGGSYQTTAKRVVRHYRNRWRLLKKHNRLIVPWLLKPSLAARHFAELAILKGAGQYLFPDPLVLEDKLSSRQQLLEGVWRDYDNRS